MPTPRQLRDSALRLERQAQGLLAEARALRVVADQIDQLRYGTQPLTSPDKIAKNDEMAQVQSEGSPRKRGRPLNVKDAGPYARAALKLGMSGVDLAAALDVKYATAMNWDREGRRIPDDVQVKIDKLLTAKAKADAKGK